MDSVSRVNEAATALQELARITEEYKTRRPALIRVARAAGLSWPDIAEAAQVSRVTVINLSKIDALPRDIT